MGCSVPVSQAGDVGAVFVDDEGGDEDRENQEGELLIGQGPVTGDGEDDVGDGEADGAGDGA